MARRLTSTAPTISIDMSLRLMEAENQYTQAAGADGGGDGHDANVHHHGGAHTGEDHRHGDGQFDHAQALAEGHADAFGGLANARFDAGQRQVRCYA